MHMLKHELEQAFFFYTREGSDEVPVLLPLQAINLVITELGGE